MESGIGKYIAEHSTGERPFLDSLHRAANIHMLHGRMSCGHEEGSLLRMIMRMIKPMNVLEIGTFCGYSAICMAEGIPEGGKVWTFEVNDEQEPFTRPWIERSGVAHKIEFIIGDGVELAAGLGVEFDAAFIDGDKRTYAEAYRTAMGVVKKGGFIIADNTLWDGHVADPEYDYDPQTKGIRDFNDIVAADERVEQLMLPLRDGLTIIYKKT